MYDDPQFDLNRHKVSVQCAECGTKDECVRRMKCMLKTENTPKPVMILTPNQWRNAPSVTYRFGAIEVSNDERTAYLRANQRWFKTKKAALTYARIIFKNFAIADYWER